MAIDDGTSVTTKLLTLLNVSATKIGKRKRPIEEFVPAGKLNKRKSISFSETVSIKTLEPDHQDQEEEEKEDETAAVETPEREEEEATIQNTEDHYENHFGPSSAVVSEQGRLAVDQNSWTTFKETVGKLGPAVVAVPNIPQATTSKVLADIDVLPKVNAPLKKRQSRMNRNQVELQNDVLSALCSRKDLYLSSAPVESRQATRQAIALHALNHISKKRRRVLKNNERIAHSTKSKPDAPPPEDVQDQGFTRPSILILLPFRNSALDWFHAITSHTPSPEFQIENNSRFLAEYDLPAGVVDRLASADPGTYPFDHVETFKGNVDDNFRMGIKMTRKTVKPFTEFYGCDLIIASPLGLRRSIEKEKNADYLSSIEIMVVDQMDALTMQNWEHVKFVLSHLNKLPKESHDTDFSRIKPWYLDGLAPYLRQTVLLSAFETPETRALYNNELKNVAGKVRTEKRWQPVQIPAGIDPNFVHFDCTSPQDEADRRFNYFTSQVLPTVMKSAVQSTNTVIFVPSSFDFIQVHNHFRKSPGVTFTVLSEYSSNADISRARLSFFKGEKNFLLISERFHFYKRYKIRGIRNLIFYGLPDHPQYFSEFLSYPFLDDGVEPSDVTCRAMFSKYDWFRLERVAGTEAALELVKSQ
ncbi:digestive organ expansion factor [Coprinopsis marcescibilis]|uniref:U3 small nucleolar RNA-associated protein 25 n=1 Tax=Coprinopsis marcescibilis TaxID=230819 RepID=A0A5C3KE57_COPMA|nr:digestive organ expansion factor [Coprinopsis marcescibilis]